jgi:hypothetical protein
MNQYIRVVLEKDNTAHYWLCEAGGASYMDIPAATALEMMGQGKTPFEIAFSHPSNPSNIFEVFGITAIQSSP